MKKRNYDIDFQHVIYGINEKESKIDLPTSFFEAFYGTVKCRLKLPAGGIRVRLDVRFSEMMMVDAISQSTRKLK